MASSSKAASGPRITLTRSRSTSSWHLVLAPAGLPPVSATTSSIFWLPNVLLFCFRKVAMPCSIWIPPCASGPVLTVSRPILNAEPCARTYGAFSDASPTPALASPCNTLRRCIVMAVLSLNGRPLDVVVGRQHDPISRPPPPSCAPHPIAQCHGE